jgi:hypothetical protein
LSASFGHLLPRTSLGGGLCISYYNNYHYFVERKRIYTTSSLYFIYYKHSL